MKYKTSQLIKSLFITAILMLILEIISTAVLPAVGFNHYKIGLHTLIILYLGFRLDSVFLPIFILLLQCIHSAFSIEGWAIGTFAGVLVCALIQYLKEIVHISSKITTIIFVAAFELAWFVIVASVVCIKIGDFTSFFDRLLRFIPEGLMMSLLAPYLFILLDFIWRLDDSDEGVVV